MIYYTIQPNSVTPAYKNAHILSVAMWWYWWFLPEIEIIISLFTFQVKGKYQDTVNMHLHNCFLDEQADGHGDWATDGRWTHFKLGGKKNGWKWLSNFTLKRILTSTAQLGRRKKEEKKTVVPWNGLPSSKQAYRSNHPIFQTNNAAM